MAIKEITLGLLIITSLNQINASENKTSYNKKNTLSFIHTAEEVSVACLLLSLSPIQKPENSQVAQSESNYSPLPNDFNKFKKYSFYANSTSGLHNFRKKN